MRKGQAAACCRKRILIRTCFLWVWSAAARRPCHRPAGPWLLLLVPLLLLLLLLVVCSRCCLPRPRLSCWLCHFRL
jgi:hypothetical protein